MYIEYSILLALNSSFCLKTKNKTHLLPVHLFNIMSPMAPLNA